MLLRRKILKEEIGSLVCFRPSPKFMSNFARVMKNSSFDKSNKIDKAIDILSCNFGKILRVEIHIYV